MILMDHSQIRLYQHRNYSAVITDVYVAVCVPVPMSDFFFGHEYAQGARKYSSVKFAE